MGASRRKGQPQASPLEGHSSYRKYPCGHLRMAIASAEAGTAPFVVPLPKKYLPELEFAEVVASA